MCRDAMVGGGRDECVERQWSVVDVTGVSSDTLNAHGVMLKFENVFKFY